MIEGKRFGEYELVGKLGQGGMGAVYKARQTSLDRLVAIKVLPPSLGENATFIARFRREAKVAAALNHPNIVQVFSAGEHEGQHYFAMEFVDGETLQARVRRKGRIAPAEAVAVCLYISRGLEYAWRKARVIHRDIKPDNIFISSDGDVKIGDLGLAKAVDGQTPALTITDASLGTPNYISPEQVMADPGIDFRADIYSLGCTLFYALTGVHPYSGNGAAAIMMMHVNEPPPDILKVWPECPTPVARLIERMLKKKPAERHPSYEELAAELLRTDRELSRMAAVAAKRKAVEAARAARQAATPAASEAQTMVVPAPAARPARASSFGKIAGAVAAVLAVAAGAAVYFGTRGIPAKKVLSQVVPSATKSMAPASSKLAPSLVAVKPTVAAAAVPKPLEQNAIRLWDSAAALPNDPNCKWENDALRLDQGGIQARTIRSRDGVFRADFLMNQDAGGTQLGIRDCSEAAPWMYYMLALSVKRRVLGLSCMSLNPHRNLGLGEWPLPRAYRTDEWARVELRAVADEFTISVDGHVLATARDATLMEAGCPRVFAHSNGFFRNISYVPLDGTGNSASKVKSKPDTEAPAEGEAWVSPATGMEFVWVPALKLWVGKYEVTNGEYQQKEPGHDSKDFRKESLNGERQPVVGVNFDDAATYAAWLTECDGNRLGGMHYRVPSEAEWQAFAQCGDGREYPWGNAMPPKYGNFTDLAVNRTFSERLVIDSYEDGYAVTCPVEKSGANEWGLYGVGGNVWECCASNSNGSVFGAWRGASWCDNKSGSLRCEMRGPRIGSSGGINYGFRLVLSR